MMNAIGIDLTADVIRAAAWAPKEKVLSHVPLSRSSARESGLDSVFLTAAVLVQDILRQLGPVEGDDAVKFDVSQFGKETLLARPLALLDRNSSASPPYHVRGGKPTFGGFGAAPNAPKETPEQRVSADLACGNVPLCHGVQGGINYLIRSPGVTVSPHMALAALLTDVRQKAEVHLASGGPILKATLSIPDGTGTLGRSAIIAAAQLAGFEDVELRSAGLCAGAATFFAEKTLSGGAPTKSMFVCLGDSVSSAVSISCTGTDNVVSACEYDFDVQLRSGKTSLCENFLSAVKKVEEVEEDLEKPSPSLEQHQRWTQIQRQAPHLAVSVDETTFTMGDSPSGTASEGSFAWKTISEVIAAAASVGVDLMKRSPLFGGDAINGSVGVVPGGDGSWSALCDHIRARIATTIANTPEVKPVAVSVLDADASVRGAALHAAGAVELRDVLTTTIGFDHQGMVRPFFTAGDALPARAAPTYTLNAATNALNIKLFQGNRAQARHCAVAGNYSVVIAQPPATQAASEEAEVVHVRMELIVDASGGLHVTSSRVAGPEGDEVLSSLDVMVERPGLGDDSSAVEALHREVHVLRDRAEKLCAA